MRVCVSVYMCLYVCVYVCVCMGGSVCVRVCRPILCLSHTGPNRTLTQ